MTTIFNKAKKNNVILFTGKFIGFPLLFLALMSGCQLTMNDPLGSTGSPATHPTASPETNPTVPVLINPPAALQINASSSGTPSPSSSNSPAPVPTIPGSPLPAPSASAFPTSTPLAPSFPSPSPSALVFPTPNPSAPASPMPSPSNSHSPLPSPTNSPSASPIVSSPTPKAKPPLVTSISPSIGMITGGTLVTIDGSGFATGATVQVGGIACTAPILMSSSQVSCITGISRVGSVFVTVMNLDGQQGSSASSIYTYTDVPQPSSIGSLLPTLPVPVTLQVSNSSNCNGSSSSLISVDQFNAYKNYKFPIMTLCGASSVALGQTTSEQISHAQLVAAASLGNDMLVISNFQDSSNSKRNYVEEMQHLANIGPAQITGHVLGNYASAMHSLASSISKSQDQHNLSMLYAKLHSKTINRHRVLQSRLKSPETVANLKSSQIRLEIDQLSNLVASASPNLVSQTEGMSALTQSSPVACTGQDIGFVENEDAGYSLGAQVAHFSSSGLYSNFNFPLKPYLTCIKDQASRDTCGAFSDAAALETEVALKYHLFINLSEEQIYFQAHAIDNDLMGPGMSTIPAVLGIANYRIPLEKEWTYNSMGVTPTGSECNNQPYCSNTEIQGKVVCNQISPGQCGVITPPINYNAGLMVLGTTSIFDPTNPAQSMQHLIQLLTSTTNPEPIVIGMGISSTMASEMATEGNGFISMSTGGIGGHGMELTGFVSNFDIVNMFPHSAPSYAVANPIKTDGYFILKNQWGMRAGDSGFHYIPLRQLENNLWIAWTPNDVDLAM